MRRVLILVVFAALVLSGFSQEQHAFSDFLFGQNHWTVSYNHGITQSTVSRHYGDYSPSTQTNSVVRVDLEYTLQFNDKWGANLGMGIGAFPVGFGVSEDLPPEISGGLTRAPLTRFSLNLNYRSKLSDHYILHSYIGGNLNLYENSVGSSSSSMDGSIKRVSVANSNRSTPAGFIGAGISRVLGNGDLLTLRLGYTYSFENIWDGNYYAEQNEERIAGGRIYNRGHYPEAGLAYTFTRASKSKKLTQIAGEKTEKTDVNEVKRDYKLSDRKEFAEKQMLLTAMGGAMILLQSIDDPADEYINPFYFRGNWYLGGEYRLSDRFFAEAGIGYNSYKPVHSTGSRSSYSGNAYTLNTWNASFGGGYRLIGKKNFYNYLNLHAGASVGFARSYDGELTFETLENMYPSFQPDFSNVEMEVRFNEVEQKSRVVPLAYIGASKDFKLSANIYLNIMYRYHQGFVSIMEQRIHRFGNPDYSEPATYTSRGSYHAVQFGLRIGL